MGVHMLKATSKAHDAMHKLLQFENTLKLASLKSHMTALIKLSKVLHRARKRQAKPFHKNF